MNAIYEVNGEPAGQVYSSANRPSIRGNRRRSLGIRPAHIVLVDDDANLLQTAGRQLEDAGFANVTLCDQPLKAIGMMEENPPDLVLTDLFMPQFSGIDLLRRIRQHDTMDDVPVIVMTSGDDRLQRTEALDLGANDFLIKPFEATQLIPRVRNVLKAKIYQDRLEQYADDLEAEVCRRTEELRASRLELILCMGRAAEYRDNETGRHVKRVGRYSGIIARQLELGEDLIELIEHAAPLHDVGKIGIPDSILLKPGKLDPMEFELMQKHTGYGKRVFECMSADEWAAFTRHTSLGASMLDAVSSPIVKMAGSIALTHHERWDGTGYPLGLAGEDIPLEGRIVAVADVFDALSSRRPYKPPYPLDKCFEIMEAERGKQFDPQVLDAFLACRPEIVSVQIELADVT